MSPSFTHFFVRGPCAQLRHLVLLTGIALACSVALAQAGSGPGRVDEPPLPPGDGTGTFWQQVQVPLLPAGASLGALWTHDPGELYVWSIQVADAAGSQASVLPRSRLLHWKGASWSVALDVAGEAGASVFGNCTNDVFAATSAADGTARMYHFDGARWSAQALPAGTIAPVGAIAGKMDDVYFRAECDVLRYDGSTWQHVLTMNDDFASALTYVGPNEIYANCCTGHCSWDGTTWCHHECGTFRNVEASWGVREYAGNATAQALLCPPPLSMYAAGRSEVTDGFAVWRFDEDSPGTMQGRWVTVPFAAASEASKTTGALPPRVPDDPEDPPSGGAPSPGDGVAVWGSSGSDVYVAGRQAATGLLYHFDGASWSRLAPIADMTLIAGVWGSGPGDVWVDFKDGRLLHYTGGAEHPNPIAGVAGPPALPPAQMMTGTPRALATRVVQSGHGVVTLEYAVPREGEVSVVAFDVAGRCIAVIERGQRGPGTHTVSWNTAGFARGLYFCQVRAGGAAVSQRVVLLD